MKGWMAGCLVAVAGLAVGAAEPSRGAAGAPPAAGQKAKEGSMIVTHASGKWDPGLDAAEQETLFAIATDTLKWCTSHSRERFSYDAYTLTPRLKQRLATFVTLKQAGDLRGCIGSLAPTDALYLSVHENAVNASLRDPRFRPVSTNELPHIEVHISILSPIVAIPSLDDFRVGEHGIIIEKGPARAVYLPEVAVEQHWTKEQTLVSLCEKAGLPPQAWREGASFKVFSSVALARP